MVASMRAHGTPIKHIKGYEEACCAWAETRGITTDSFFFPVLPGFMFFLRSLKLHVLQIKWNSWNPTEALSPYGTSLDCPGLDRRGHKLAMTHQRAVGHARGTKEGPGVFGDKGWGLIAKVGNGHGLEDFVFRTWVSFSTSWNGTLW